VPQAGITSLKTVCWCKKPSRQQFNSQNGPDMRRTLGNQFLCMSAAQKGGDHSS
jgi:hypothetical protein